MRFESVDRYCYLFFLLHWLFPFSDNLFREYTCIPLLHPCHYVPIHPLKIHEYI